jgi:2-phospho-L-lactate transferase/gluconeogenesis factor (CofD/UPF0052 family)
MLNVVVINGGRGAATLIPALLDRQGLHVTSVVNAYDDGKSTGEIRRFFGMLGPSDIRKVQELMLPKDDPDYDSNLKLFQYRFPESGADDTAVDQIQRFVSGATDQLIGVGFTSAKVRSALRKFLGEFLTGLKVIEKVRGEKFNFADCSLMNCIYAGAFLVFDRNFGQVTSFIDRLFRLRGTVLPTSIENKQLVALRENGQMLYSEAEIVELRSNVRVDRIYLLDSPLSRASFEYLNQEEKRYYLERHHCYVALSPAVKLALKQANVIIYAAGTQHSSLYPTYLSAGLADWISDNKNAVKVFVTNIGADYETPSYKASDYIKGAHRYLNMAAKRHYDMEELFDAVLVNQSRLKAGETYVELDEEGLASIPVRQIRDCFESPQAPGRHLGPKVVQTVLDLYESSISLG